jgi:hypothetical protein
LRVEAQSESRAIERRWPPALHSFDVFPERQLPELQFRQAAPAAMKPQTQVIDVCYLGSFLSG